MAAKSDGAALSVQTTENPVPPPLRCMVATEPDHGPSSCRYASKPYSLLDCCWVLCSLLVFFSDGATDLWLAADYYLRRDYWWFGLTLVFVVVPSAVVQVLSFRWIVYDYTDISGSSSGAVAAVSAAAAAAAESSKGGECNFSTKGSTNTNKQRGGGAANAATVGGVGCSSAGQNAAGAGTESGTRTCCRVCMWLFQSILHLLQLGQVWRYVHALYLGAQSSWHGNRGHFHWRLMCECADITMLRLLEAFLKSAPQLVLQLSIMIHANHVLPLQGLSASASLVSLAWIIASYQKTLRDSRDDKLPMSYKAVIVQMLWHFFTIGARTIAFALFASVFQLYFGIFVVSHWCLMTFWIIQGETDFCMSKWEEIIYNMVVGIVYIFCWFNVKEGRARFRMWLYHTVTLVENVSLIAAWYLYRGPNTSDFYALIVVCVVVCSYALGIFFMLGYYCLLHPDGPVSAAQWGGCVEDGGLMVESCVTPAEASPLPPPDVVTSPPRTLTRTAGTDRGEVVPGDLAVFQVRSTTTTSPALAPRPLRTEGPVIRIDLPRKRYPAWDAHFIDRRLRKTILVLENTSPVTPRIQYRSLSKPKEVMEYETTV
ncbi:XK-related protein 7-like [Oncorhynchus kisutch]|uniref:XK-related protein n=1 Tax=Oncorhynchus kisutch TaxID=8019 RepID=A0A8C7CZA4_ONCKI|nr:XK-related protein 7-like [Oncorhynchus kisutch]